MRNVSKKKTLKVSKISLESLDRLRELGYDVLIEQVTIKPKNPRVIYAFEDAINVLTKKSKYKVDHTTSSRVCRRKHAVED